MPEKLVLDKELHLHLFGCLTAEDLWKQGQVRRKECETRIEWFVQEYKKAYGRKPLFESYLEKNKEKAIKAIEKDIICNTKRSFEEFQASFNFIIALHPNRTEDPQVLDRVAKNLSQQKMKYAELRTLLPRTEIAEEQFNYLSEMSKTCLSWTNTIDIRLLITVPRDTSLQTSQYALISKWKEQNPDLQIFIKGIDICMDEQDDPPMHRAEFYQSILSSGLDLSVHVGEVFDRIGMLISTFWVLRAAQLGVPRIGHATVVGCNAKIHRGEKLEVKASYRLAFYEWARDNLKALQDFGFPDSSIELENDIVSLKKNGCQTAEVIYNEKEISRIEALQSFTLSVLKDQGTHIECCPSSNYILGPLDHLKDHPVKVFLKNGVSCSISSDDPGIFDTSLEKEIKICREIIGLSEEDMMTIRKATDQISL